MNRKKNDNGWCRWLRIATLLAAMVLPTMVWAQHPFTLTTADDVANGTETLYWIESKGATGFFMIPHTDNSSVSTSNKPNERMLWYFMDASVNNTQYYFIVNKSTGKYLRLDGTLGSNNTIKVADYDNNNADYFRFSITGSAGQWIFYPKSAGTSYWVNKQAGNVRYDTYFKSSNYGGSPDDNSKWNFIAQNSATWAHPFTNSTSSDKHYYLIQNRHKDYTSYYMSTNASNHVTVSTANDNKRVWYFIEAAPNDTIPNLKYYYIVNAETGKYMYFSSNTLNGNATSNSIQIQEYASGVDEDRYQFAVLNAKGDKYSAYSIAPKKLLNYYYNKSIGLGTSTMADNNQIGTINDRGSNDNPAHWTIEATTYAPDISAPSFEVNCDNNLTLSCATPSASIYYTTSTSSGTPDDPDITSTEYTGPITGLTDGDKVKAIAYNEGYYSVIADTTFHPAYSVAPTITFAANTATISYASEATIYYTITEDGSEPATPTTSSYTAIGAAPLVVTIDPTKDVRIRAIAKAADRANASCNYAEGRQLPQPTFDVDCANKLTLSTTVVGGIIYYTTSSASETPDDPTTSGINYTDNPIPISLNDGDKVKVVVTSGGNLSIVTDYTFHPTYSVAPTITFTGSNTVRFTYPGATAVIRYTMTTNGNTPDEPTDGTATTVSAFTSDGNGNYYGELAIEATQDVHIRAKAQVMSGALNLSCAYAEAKHPAKPGITITADDCSAASPRGNVMTITGADDGRTFWYAITPGENSAAPNVDAVPNPYTDYTAVVDLSTPSSSNSHYTLHAYAKLANGNVSAITSQSHEMKTSGKPTLTSPTGASNELGISGGAAGDTAICTHSNEGTVKLLLSASGNATYAVPNADGTVTVTFKHGKWQPSCSETYTVPDAPAIPTYSQTCDNQLDITCSTSGAELYYTTDGTEPTRNSTAYTDGCLHGITAGTTVKVAAYLGFRHTTLSYIYTPEHTTAPTITVSGTTATITAVDGATIRYTTDGTEPTIDNTNPASVTYNGTIGVSQNEDVEIRAIAKATTLEASCVTVAKRLKQPAITIADGDCSPTTTANILTLTSTDDGRTLWYAVTAGENSAAPSVSAVPNPYTQYNTEEDLSTLSGDNTHYTVHTYALSSDGTVSSEVISVDHLMKTTGIPELTEPSGSSPVIHIAGGAFGDVAKCVSNVGTQNITLESSGECDYTIPTGAAGTITFTFKRGNWQESCPATYVLPTPPATPTSSQTCDNTLSLHCESGMAEIHYTTDGSEVSRSSATYVEGCLKGLAYNTPIRAKSYQGFQSSDELSFTYTATHTEVPQIFVDGTEVTISAPAGATIYYTKEEGIGAGVLPADPADPSNPAAIGRTEYTDPIGIAAGGILTVFRAVAKHPDLDSSCVVRVVTRQGYSINKPQDLEKLNAYPSSYFFVLSDIDAANTYPTTTVNKFTGVLDGGYYTISHLNKPLFDTVTGTDAHNAAVLGVILKDATVTATGGAGGAIANHAKGYSRIYNCGILDTSSITGADTVGSLVGVLDGEARVINCFSYANIDGGDYRGGIVGYNTHASTSADLKTMVMNCMFYGDIATTGSPTQIAPIYGGEKIGNKAQNNGLNNYNYFKYNSKYVSSGAALTYNCALGAEERFLNRFEFYRLILNSNNELAAWYVTGSTDNATDHIAKWVLDRSIAPYPILKAHGTYPSVMNPDEAHAIAIDADNVHRNEGRKLGTLTVHIKNTKSDGGQTWPDGAAASITTTPLTLNITDKDPDNFNFNYRKVQLPYYNEVGDKNYTGNRVVTGWKIVDFHGGGTPGNYTTGVDVVFDANGNITSTPYNFADRACTNKDYYGTNGSKRIFNQGAYWEVPDGVTEITIEPYWAKCVYLSDENYDVVFNNQIGTGVAVTGTRPSTIANNTDNNTIYHDFQTAYNHLGSTADQTVYDYAIVLVGNYHKSFGQAAPTNEAKPYTIMSADMDHDNEPDNTFFYHHDDRRGVSPIRFDFINIPGIGMAQKEDNTNGDFQPGIFQPRGWFEITNTVLIRFGQFEYSDGKNRKIAGPVILQGGIYEQFVSARNSAVGNNLQYLLIGGNSWFKNCAFGCHSGSTLQTKKVPVTVTGGDYEHFYLTGIYKASLVSDPENVECYIDGGRFGEVAGAGQQNVDGSVTWLINGADITSFFGGGINSNSPVSDNIYTRITNSWVDEFCGGPKFGNMNDGKKVTTIASNCNINTFFGAGYGGTALNRIVIYDYTYEGVDYTGWDGWVNTYYLRKYQAKQNIIESGKAKTVTVNAVSTNYEYEYLFYSGGTGIKKVARFYVNFASLSLANTKNVSSTLNGCRLGNFYGGGKLGAVDGNVVSTLTDCIVEGNVYGSGYSAAVPTVNVISREKGNGDNTIGFRVRPEYNNTANAFNSESVEYGDTVTYTWSNDASLFTLTGANPEYFYDNGTTHLIYTNQGLSNLGAVLGNAMLTLDGNTVVKGDVYGGGALSSSNTTTADSVATCKVEIKGGTYGTVSNSVVSGGNIYGGGQGDSATAVTEGRTEVHIGASDQDNNNVVINGMVFGGNNVNGTPKDSSIVHIWKTKHNGNNVVGSFSDKDAFASYTATDEAHASNKFALQAVYGGGNVADYKPTTANKSTQVHIHNCDNTVKMVYGGGRAAAVGTDGGTQAGANVIVDGGRIDTVFAGGDGHTTDGNGDYIAANIYGGAGAAIHGGYITAVFGGSNTAGTITGTKSVTIDKQGPCPKEYIGSLFGGSNLANIEGDVNFTVDCGAGSFNEIYGGCNEAQIINGNVTLTVNGGTFDYVFGGSKGTDTKAANIQGNVTLNLHGGTIANAFGGSNKKGNVTGKITVNVEDTCTACPMNLTNVYGGGKDAAYEPTTAGDYPEVNVKHGTVHGNVFGGGLGETAVVTSHPKVIIGDTVTVPVDHSAYQAIVEGDIYGGGDAADVTGTPTVLVQKCNSIVNYVYGGGNAAHVSATNVVITGGAVDTVFGGGHGDKDANPQVSADVAGDANVTVGGGTINKVFGGSNSKGNITGDINVIVEKDADACDLHITELYGGGNYAASQAGNIDIRCTGTGANEGIDYVYGGANRADVTGPITLTIQEGRIANVFGGNNNSGEITGAITVNINKKTSAAPCVWEIGNVFGGGNLASYDGSPAVNILNGTVSGNVYGGGNGSASDHTKGATTGATVTVGDITKVADNTIQAIVVGDVYGGGNAANVNGTPTVTVVKKCNTEIGYVYGGGNAADVNGTFVAIAGGTIGNVFGGGHGDNTPGSEKVADVKGNDTITITGGTIGKVFAGSNLNGNITGRVGLKIDKAADACAMKIGQVYGGGNEAESKAGKIDIACTGTLAALGSGERYGYDQEGIGAVYGGANKADVSSGNIVLNINSGIVDSVFGGNNQSGNISGNITVNINKSNSSCDWYVGDVFGGGNLASYDGSPAVNILNGTVSGNVYGGGNGSASNHTKGATTGATVTVGDITKLNNDNIQAIVVGDVYGGGNAANVNGTPTVTVVKKCNTEIGYVYGGGNAADVNGTLVAIAGGTIGNVFGGGHGDNTPGSEKVADVKGNDTITITGGTIGKVFAGSNLNGNITGRVGLKIDKAADACAMKIGEVYGGGNQAESKAGNINIGCTGVKVALNTGERYGYDQEGISVVYGGANAANVTSGNIVLTISSGIIDSVFGGNNTSGSINGSITVNIDKDNSSCDWYVGNVFGGGNKANYTYSPAVNIKNGKVTYKVFGGGNQAHVGGSVVTMSGGEVDTLFGGGNLAGATGTVSVTQTAGTVFKGLYGGCNANGTVNDAISVNIKGGAIGENGAPASVFGGGLGHLTQTGNNVTVTIDSSAHVYGDVYGGSALGQVNNNNSHLTKVWLKGGTIEGNIYGGGLGKVGAADSGQVNGRVEVLVEGGSVTDVFGCNNTNGAPKSTVQVDINETTPGTMTVGNVYGGGNLAPYTGSPTVNVTAGTVNNVFGGGKGNTAIVTGNPMVTIKGTGTVGKLGNGNNLIDGTGNVFGGGDAAKVDGNTSVKLQGSATVRGNVYGGGNNGPVTGSSNVSVQD